MAHPVSVEYYPSPFRNDHIKYYILAFRKKYNAYPNAGCMSPWNYIRGNPSGFKIDIDLNKVDYEFKEPDFQWQRDCDKYILKWKNELKPFFEKYMSHLLETKINIIPLKKDLSIRTPKVYDLSVKGTLSNIYPKTDDSIVTLYPQENIIQFFNGNIPKIVCEEGNEVLSNIDQWYIDLEDPDEENIAGSLNQFLQDYEPDLSLKLKKGDGIFFGDYYRNNGYFFYDGRSIVGCVADIPGVHDYGIPPHSVREFYPFDWEDYGFLAHRYIKQ